MYVYIKNFIPYFCYVLMISVVAVFNNSEHKGVSLGHFIWTQNTVTGGITEPLNAVKVISTADSTDK